MAHAAEPKRQAPPPYGRRGSTPGRAEKRRAAAGGRAALPPRWPVWTATAVTGLYVLIHLDMLPPALTLLGGLMSALLLGE